MDSTYFDILNLGLLHMNLQIPSYHITTHAQGKFYHASSSA